MITEDSIGRTLRLVEELGIVRPRDLDRHGLARQNLIRLERRGLLRRLGRGIYVAASHTLTEYHALAEVSKRAPRAVICLLSALWYHDLTSQAPYQVWIAIGNRDRKPRIEWPPIQTARFSDAALRSGIEERLLEGVKVRVFGVAKTVVDCFAYRSRVGLDVALEALRQCRAEGRCSMDDLWRFAEVCRMTNVMRPYLESVA
jgi:predicted transcriptional regulator of viral defense system